MKIRETLLIGDALPGMHLADAVMDDAGRVLVPGGAELTESMLLSDVEDAVRKMRELRSIGVGFSLDDFGTGYSSLAYLKHFTFHEIKVDGSFVRAIEDGADGAAIVKAVVALGHPERADSVLLLRRRTPPGIGRWCVPGGFIGYGERPEAAAAREVREEVGVEAEIGPVLRAGLVDYLYRGRRICILEVAYIARPKVPFAGLAAGQLR